LPERMSHSELRGQWDSFSLRFLPVNRMVLPLIAKHTIGVVAVGARRYIDWLGALYRYVVISDRLLSPVFMSLTPMPISPDMLPSLLGLWQSGLRGTRSSTPDKIRMRHLKVCRSSISLVDCFSAYIFVLEFCSSRSSAFSG
jgi:hypothetical protein